MKILNIILRYLFSWIDAITAKLITTVYRLLSNLSEIVLYSDEMIRVIGKRIGLLLGVFMLFKLAITLINYMISPDKISDGKQGGGKLIINIAISLTLLISINFIFKEAYRIQGIIVNSKVIEKIFFGTSGIVKSTNDNEDDSEKMDIGYYLYTGFIYPNKEVFGDTCDKLWDTRFDITQREVGQTKTCDEVLHDKLPDDARRSIYKARNTLDMSYVFFEYDLISSSGNLSDVLDFDYTPIISNVAGIIVLLVLISFSMDLATRAVKLLFLQIIAPIPILSYMDTGKGQDIFKKWGKECINTYLSVFIRLIAINFAVFMIVLLRGNYRDVFVNNIWLNIFLIIGCLMFAKQVPKLLEDFFGIKSDGMTLNPLKKFEEQAMFGKNITGLVAGATVGTMGALTGAGVLQGFKGAWSGMTGGKGFKESWKGQVGANKTMRDALRDGSTFLGRRAAHLTSTLGISTPSEMIESQVHAIDEQIKDIDNRMKPLNDSIADRDAYTNKNKAMEERAQQRIKDGDAGLISEQYKAMVNRAEKLREDLRNGRGGVTEQMVAEAEMRANHYLTNEGTYEYIDYATGLAGAEVGIYDATGNRLGSTTNATRIDISDGGMISMNDDLISMTNTPTTYTYVDAHGVTQSVTIDSTAISMGASARHGHANQVSGSVNADKRTRVAQASTEKQNLEHQKAELYERQRVARANQSAIGK